ncbi:MAG: multicopper oxidase domain-containing protein [Ilumatobacteraceae bacterium]
MTNTLIEPPPVASGATPPGPAPSRSPGADSPFGSLVFVAVAAIVVATVVAIGALGVAALATRDSGSAAAIPTTQLAVTLSEFAIGGDLTAPAGHVVLNVANTGTIDHTVVVRGTALRSQPLSTGGSAVLDLGTLAAGTYTLFCDVPGHESSGMTADLVITDDPSGAAGAAATADGAGAMDGSMPDGTAMDGAAMDQVMVESMLAFPAATEGLGNQPLAFEELADGTKQFELTAAVVPWEKSPGEFVDAWAYNGQVPGPQIRLDLGDSVRIIVHNETPLGTDVHWHGIHTPNQQDGVSPFTQDPISSGDSFTYEFTVDDPAIGMYHAHLHSQTSVLNGMFGTFIVGDDPFPYGTTVSGVDIPADLVPAVDMPMVLNDAGVIGLTLNGKSFPATEPLVLEQGDWAAVHYYNEGLMAHPMHLHQFPQLVYAKDGIPLDQPYWADTINVAPGERYSVLFHAEDVGTWVWHCHILNHVETDEGMFGMVTAVVVNPPA